AMSATSTHTRSGGAIIVVVTRMAVMASRPPPPPQSSTPVDNVSPVSWERRKPSWIRKAQQRELRGYLAQHVYPYSPYYQVRFDEAGLGQRGVRSFDDLAQVPPTVFDDIVNPASVVLRP